MSEHPLDLHNATAEEVLQCLEAALGGDTAQLALVISTIKPVIHVRVMRAMMRRHQEAKGRDLRADLEDLVQEVFAALFANEGRALRRWDASRGLSFINFVGFLAEREVAMAMRTGKRNPWTEDPTLGPTLVYLKGATECDERRIESRAMLSALSDRLRERLSPEGRLYFQRLLIEDRPIKEVSNETGISADALYAWRSRLRRLLRELRTEILKEGSAHE